MKLRFTEQSYQLDAVNAVVKCFEGQPFKTNRFTLEKTIEILKRAKDKAQGVSTIDFEIEEEIGYRNSSLQITDKQIFDNIVKVQREHYLIENQKLDLVKGATSELTSRLKWKRVRVKLILISVPCTN